MSGSVSTGSGPPRRPSDLEVERWRLGELDAERAERVRAALEVLGDPRAASTEAEDAALFERISPERFAREVSRRARVDESRESDTARQDGSRLQWMFVPVAVAAVLLLGFLIWSQVGAPWSASPHEGSGVNGAPRVAVRDDMDAGPIRIKGQRPSLIVRVKQGDELLRLQRGDEVAAGDVLQLSYVAAGAAHGVIVSIDGNGLVTLHLPAEPTRDTRLTQRKETPIGHSYELDDAPRFERFVFVTSNARVDPDAVLVAARALARRGPDHAQRDPLDLPDDLVQTSIVVHKEN